MPPRNTRVQPETEVRSPARSFLSSLDNFYAPARDTRKQQAFQQGINAFSGILGEQAALNKQEQRADETQQGVADAMREQAGVEMEGVRTGAIFRQNSRFYMAGLNETRGRASAARFKADTALAYQNWDGRFTDDDGSAFRVWMNERVAGFMGTLGDNQYQLAGAMPIINEVTNNWANQHTGLTASRLETESFEAYDEIISSVFSDLSSGDVDMDTAIERIAAEADDMYVTDGAEANNRVVQAAIRYANIHNDPDAILALAQAHDSGKMPLSLSNRELLADAMDAVSADIARNSNRTNAQLTASEKARNEATLNEWAATLDENPYAELPSSSVAGGAAIWGDMASLQEAYMRSAEVINPTISSIDRMSLETDLFNAGTPSAKIDILHQFVLENPTALTGAQVTAYASEITQSASPASLENNPMIARGREDFGEQLSTYQLGDGMDLNRSSTLRTQGERYYNQYMRHNAGQVDLNDAGAIDKVMQDARDFAMRQLAAEFPETLREKNDGPLAGTLGADTALEERDTAVAEQLATRFEEQAVQAAEVEAQAVEAAEQEQAVATEAAAQELEEAIEEESVPYEDSVIDLDYSPAREGFYGEVIHRFTDGVDTRTPREVGNAARLILAEDTEFASAVTDLSAELNVSESALMAIMHFESGGTFDPTIRNAAGSGATGLIQFMPATARGLGTTTEALSRMTRAEQMVYVGNYFRQFGSRLHGGNIDDLYMAVLWPAAIGKVDGYPLFRQGTIAYTQNRGLDTNGDGVITKFEAAAKVRQRLDA